MRIQLMNVIILRRKVTPEKKNLTGMFGVGVVTQQDIPHLRMAILPTSVDLCQPHMSTMITTRRDFPTSYLNAPPYGSTMEP